MIAIDNKNLHLCQVLSRLTYYSNYVNENVVRVNGQINENILTVSDHTYACILQIVNEKRYHWS